MDFQFSPFNILVGVLIIFIIVYFFIFFVRRIFNIFFKRRGKYFFMMGPKIFFDAKDEMKYNLNFWILFSFVLFSSFVFSYATYQIFGREFYYFTIFLFLPVIILCKFILRKSHKASLVGDVVEIYFHGKIVNKIKLPNFFVDENLYVGLTIRYTIVVGDKNNPKKKYELGYDVEEFLNKIPKKYYEKILDKY